MSESATGSEPPRPDAGARASNPPPGDGRTRHPLGQVVAQLKDAGDSDRVSMEDLLAAVGPRSFGPMLLVPGLIVVSPLSGIPGLPTTMGLLIALIAGQMLVGRRHPWLPRFVRRRSVDRARLQSALTWLERPARGVDRFVRPRLVMLTCPPFAQLIAVLCLCCALLFPPLELVPFFNSLTGAAVSAFALALVTHDGLLVLVALGFLAAVGWVSFSVVT